MRVGRIAATVSILLAMLTARPQLGSFDQGFQYIQEYTGFFTPGIVVIFVLGLFWKRANEAGALAAAMANLGVTATVRDGMLRISPHVGTTAASLQVLDEAFAAFTAARSTSKRVPVTVT